MTEPRQSGYSLIETLVVLVLVAVAALSATALVPSPAGPARAEATALEIASLLRSVRARATTTGERRSVGFDLGARTYGAIEEATPYRTLPLGVVLEVTTAAAAADGSRYVRLTFEADGSTEGARLVIAETRTGTRRTIDVDWLSGRVALRRTGGG